MQSNYYFLRQLSQSLAVHLKDLVLAECFSQEKDELILGFSAEGKQWRKRRDFYIRATIRPDFVALSFPDDFRRAGKNTVDLFSELLDKPVLGVRQFLNERAFSIEFADDYHLIFKLFGNRSNLVLVQGVEVVDLFHNKLVTDEQLNIQMLDRPLDQSYEAFERANGDWRKLFPTFGKDVSGWLDRQGYRNLDNSGRWALIQQVLSFLEKPNYYIKTVDYQPVLTLVPDGAEKTFTEPVEAANNFFYAYSRINVFDREKGQIVRLLQKRKQKTQLYIDSVYAKLNDMGRSIKHEEIGHIIMANLHQIPERTDGIELFDFYRDQLIMVRLKADLSPQKNAENYYRKAKNEKIEVEHLMEALEVREQEIAAYDEQIQQVESIETLKELRKYLKTSGLDKIEKPDTSPAALFKRFEYQGFEIFVGKNAKNNDLLTQRYTRKEDLWLHARDVTGSHVIIRHQAGKRFPNPVIERAAQLAAYYSKRRHDSLCPVIVTPKKYVRKTRDLQEGQVIIDKEEVVMIEPRA
ncbi:MAG: NFACT RNA binding domain-containing protein [Siphonobacter sp.]